VAGLPTGLPMVVIANEFFDAMPIRQFVVRREDAWFERMVGLEEDRLAFGLRPLEEAADLPSQPLPATEAIAGAIVEIAPAATAIFADLAERLGASGGAALVIDYGYDGPAFGDTLQAVRRHAFDDPLAAPGEADL